MSTCEIITFSTAAVTCDARSLVAGTGVVGDKRALLPAAKAYKKAHISDFVWTEVGSKDKRE